MEIEEYLKTISEYEKKAYILAGYGQLTKLIKEATELAGQLKKLVDEINLDPDALTRI